MTRLAQNGDMDPLNGGTSAARGAGCRPSTPAVATLSGLWDFRDSGNPGAA